MALSRKNTEVENLDEDLKLFSNCLTPYAFKFVQEQLQLSRHVQVLNQLNSSQFSLSAVKNVKEPHTATPSLCDCSFFTSMALPCKHIFMVRALLNMPAFCQSLVHERWTMEHYRSVERFPLMPSVHNEEDCPPTQDHASENFHLTIMQEQQHHHLKSLSQAQKFRKGLQIAQVMASLLSEGGMQTFTTRYNVLQSIARSWQLGREVTVCDDENQGKIDQCGDMEGNVGDKTVTSDFCVDEDKGTATTRTDDGQSQLDSGAKQNTPPTSAEDLEELEEREIPWNETKRGQRTGKDCDELENRSQTLLSNVKMPPKMLKRGRPKGAEVTVIGLPKAKKKKANNDHIKPFCKLSPVEKETALLRSLTSDLAASEASMGKRILGNDDLKTLHEIPDSIQEKESLDIYRVQKYFSKEAWFEVLNIIRKKEEIGWCCAVCSKVIKDECEDSIACDRCLLWSHFKCTSVKKKPKNRNWFCKSCKLKFC